MHFILFPSHSKTEVFAKPIGSSQNAIKPECNFHLGVGHNSNELAVYDFIYKANFPKGKINHMFAPVYIRPL